MKFSKVISELFFPSGIKCIVCGAELPRSVEHAVCDECTLALNEKYCLRCGRAIKNQADYCDYCKDNSFNFDKARAPFVYEDNVRKLIHNLKYGNAKYLAKEIAEYLADLYFDTGINADLITFVPMHPKAQKERGYNQAEEIAKELSKITALPVISTIKRVKYTKHFAKMTNKERADAVVGLYEILDGVEIKGKKVLLIDDVLTTGSTVNECSRLLKKSKAESVTVLTFATSRVTPELY